MKGARDHHDTRAQHSNTKFKQLFDTVQLLVNRRCLNNRQNVSIISEQHGTSIITRIETHKYKYRFYPVSLETVFRLPHFLHCPVIFSIR